MAGWVGVGGCGWVWVGVGGCGWVWVGVGGCGWVWVGEGGEGGGNRILSGASNPALSSGVLSTWLMARSRFLSAPSQISVRNLAGCVLLLLTMISDYHYSNRSKALARTRTPST